MRVIFGTLQTSAFILRIQTFPMDSKRYSKAKFDRRSPRTHEPKTQPRTSKRGSASWTTLDATVKSADSSDSELLEGSFSGSDDMDGSVTDGTVRVSIFNGNVSRSTEF
jgi:hypothetical protein